MKFRLPKELQKYVTSADVEIPQDVQSLRTTEERIVMAITETNPLDLITSELCSAVAEGAAIVRPFSIETLLPVPLLSALAADIRPDHIRLLVNWVHSRNLRLVGASGTVQRGPFGSEYFLSVGSCGRPVTAVIQGALTFAPSSSWLSPDLHAAQTTGVFLSGTANGHEFRSL